MLIRFLTTGHTVSDDWWYPTMWLMRDDLVRCFMDLMLKFEFIYPYVMLCRLVEALHYVKWLAWSITRHHLRHLHLLCSSGSIALLSSRHANALQAMPASAAPLPSLRVARPRVPPLPPPARPRLFRPATRKAASHRSTFRQSYLPSQTPPRLLRPSAWTSRAAQCRAAPTFSPPTTCPLPCPCGSIPITPSTL